MRRAIYLAIALRRAVRNMREDSKTRLCFRVTFAAADELEIEMGVKKIADAIRGEFALETID